jgi:hypothetical protein
LILFTHWQFADAIIGCYNKQRNVEQSSKKTYYRNVISRVIFFHKFDLTYNYNLSGIASSSPNFSKKELYDQLYCKQRLANIKK